MLEKGQEPTTSYQAWVEVFRDIGYVLTEPLQRLHPRGRAVANQ